MTGPTATIFAPATAAGRAGVAVVRISGPRASAALTSLTRMALPAPRHAARRRFSDPHSGAPLDDGLALWFPGPASFTGEDVAELHLHGSRAALAGVLAALGALPGLRLAEPGEFTRRAFQNGKLDLAQVEGLADLIAAETQAQARQALRQLDGEFGRRTANWRERLSFALAHAEAEIDFPDEDLPGGLIAAQREAALRIAREIEAVLDDGLRGERVRAGVAVAIVGPPNAGKSTLLNHLARREAAIVSPAPGTTRDVIEVALDLGGYAVTLADTAGLRAIADDARGHEAIEAEGIRRAQARARDADLRLVLLDAGARPTLRELAGILAPDDIVAVNKTDLAAAPGAIDGRAALGVSLKTGEGVAALVDALTARVRALCESGAGDAPLITRARHRESLVACRDALARAADAAAPELFAEDLRLALRAIGKIAGRVDVEDILDRIFREFCIGK
jgi:tRNA modification GTPase